VLETWLAGNNMLLSDFGPYGTIFMDVYVVINRCHVLMVATALLPENVGISMGKPQSFSVSSQIKE
jgi:hypothetical protein